MAKICISSEPADVALLKYGFGFSKIFLLERNVVTLVTYTRVNGMIFTIHFSFDSNSVPVY
jgi:hypothetical protein